MNVSPIASGKARRGVVTVALLAATAAAAAACSAGSTGTATAAGPAATIAVPAASAPMTAPPSSSPVSIAVGSSSLGPIAVDATGHTLYRFDKDTPGSGASACNGACAAAWPPALIDGQPMAGPGLTGALGVVTRNDGTRQLSLDGHPLYRYAGDQNPGDTTGDGFGGIWHVVHTTAAAASTPPVSSPAATMPAATMPAATMPAGSSPRPVPRAITPPAGAAHAVPQISTPPATTPPVRMPPATTPPPTSSPWPGY